jgi:hypothetical protein
MFYSDDYRELIVVPSCRSFVLTRFAHHSLSFVFSASALPKIRTTLEGERWEVHFHRFFVSDAT